MIAFTDVVVAELLQLLVDLLRVRTEITPETSITAIWLSPKIEPTSIRLDDSHRSKQDHQRNAPQRNDRRERTTPITPNIEPSAERRWRARHIRIARADTAYGIRRSPVSCLRTAIGARAGGWRWYVR